MELRVLGGIEFEDASGVVSLGTPRQRAVLALLATEAGRVVPADRIVHLLWAGEPPEQAMATLQAYVSKLRRVLEPDRAPRAPALVLVTQAPGYRLDLAPEALDARRFEALVAEAHGLGAADPTGAEQRLTEALALWRGPAYAEFADEPWAAGEAARLDDLRLGAEEDLLELRLRRGDAAAVGALERHVAAHPLRERARGLLALGLYRAGRQAEALRALDAARADLRDQLGLEPGPALRALERAILDHDPALGGDELVGRGWSSAAPTDVGPGPADGHDAASAPAGAPPQAERTAATASSPSASATVRLLGRDEVCGRLRRAVDEAADGRGSVLLVEGEAGIGKSTVAEAAVALAEAAGGVAAWGRCQDGAASPPFWPVVQAVRALLPALPAAARDALGPQLGVLWELAPDLGGRPPTTSDPQLLRLRLFDALTTVFVGDLPERPPVTLVVLDDLHLADPSSLQLVGALARHIDRSSTVLVLPFRPEELHESPAAVDLVGELAGIAAAERVVLGPLDRAAVAELLAEEAHLAPEVVAVVHERCGGNPFFATELARLLRAEDPTGAVDVAARSVPAGVRDVLRRRLARLPAEAQRLLTVAAVVGTTFEVADVADVAGTDLDTAFDLLDVVVASGLVQERPDGSWRFSHNLVADAIRSGLSTTRLARWHAQVADAMARRHGDEPDAWVAIARHHLAARAVDDPERAVPWLRRAAEHAIASAAFEQAELLLEELYELLSVERVPGRRPAEGALAPEERVLARLLVECRLGYLDVWRTGFGSPRIERFLSHAHDWAPQATPDVDAAEVFWNAALQHHQRGELASSLAMVTELDHLAVASGDETIAFLADDQGSVSMLTAGRFADSLARIDRNIERVRRVDVDVRTRALESPLVRIGVIRGLVLWHLGDDAGSAAAMTSAREASVATSVRSSAGFVRRYGVLLGLMAEDVDAVADAAGLELAETSYEEFQYPSGVVGFGLGWVAHRRGDPSGLEMMERAAAALEALSLGVTLPILWGHIATAHLEQGRVEEAVALLHRAVEVAERSEPRWLPDLLRRLAAAEAAAGDGQASEAHRVRAIGVARTQGNVALLRRLEDAQPAA